MEVVIIALENISLNPLRSLLTTAGIIIGIAAVIVIVAMGEGNREVIQKRIREMGANLLEIRNYSSMSASGENEYALSKFIDEKDIGDIAARLPAVEAIAPVLAVQRTVRYVNRDVKFDGIGTYPAYRKALNLNVKEGRFLSPFDEKEKRLVCAINETGAKMLASGRGSILEKKLYIEGVRYKVIGVIKDKDAIYNGIRPVVYIPFSTMKQQMQFIYMQNAYFTAKETGEVEKLAKQVRTILHQRYGDASKEWVHSMAEFLETEKTVSTQTTLVILGVASISLLVGGVGIMNMMLVTVRERTSEIGIRKALGATGIAILSQFLAEGTILCIIGGLIGIISGIFIANAAAPILQVPVRISWLAVFTGLIFSSAVGLSSSLYPAYKAAGLLPVEALRYE